MKGIQTGFDENGTPLEKEYLECGLPEMLEASKQKFIEGEKRYKAGGYTLF